MNDLWQSLAQRANLSLDPSQLALLEKYLDLLIAANERMNLTRITDRAAAELLHIGDSLTVLPFLPAEPHALADVGSGGGVPGIVLAIARPDVRVTLIESTQKKSAFLKQAVAELGLTNVKVDSRRAEDMGLTEVRGTFNVAVARAVATMDWLVEWMLPLVKKGGYMLAMKGPKAQEELLFARKAIRLLYGGEPSIHPANLQEGDHRVIVKIVKMQPTAKEFPRASTTTKGKPI
jgi:16S rRNA (guanine527-N7)-methyltransferase